MKNLDKFTAGKSPAAVYLVDFLNTDGTFKDRNALKFLCSFRKMFNQLTTAVKSGAISDTTLSNFCSMKRESLKQECQKHIEAGINPLVVDLYHNLVIADLKSYTRKSMIYARVLRSGITKAKNVSSFNTVDTSVNSLDVNVVSTKVEGTEYRFDVTVFKDGNATTALNVVNMYDNVTNDYLIAKSRRNLAKRGKLNTYYK